MDFLAIIALVLAVVGAGLLTAAYVAKRRNSRDLAVGLCLGLGTSGLIFAALCGVMLIKGVDAENAKEQVATAGYTVTGGVEEAANGWFVSVKPLPDNNCSDTVYVEHVTNYVPSKGIFKDAAQRVGDYVLIKNNDYLPAHLDPATCQQSRAHGATPKAYDQVA